MLGEGQNVFLNKVYISFAGLIGGSVAATHVIRWYSRILPLSTYCLIQSTIADAVNSKKGHLAHSSGYSTITDIVNTGV